LEYNSHKPFLNLYLMHKDFLMHHNRTWCETGSVNENDGALCCPLPGTPLHVPLPAARCPKLPCVSLCVVRCCPYVPPFLLFFTQLQFVAHKTHLCLNINIVLFIFGNSTYHTFFLEINLPYLISVKKRKIRLKCIICM